MIFNRTYQNERGEMSDLFYVNPKLKLDEEAVIIGLAEEEQKEEEEDDDNLSDYYDDEEDDDDDYLEVKSRQRRSPILRPWKWRGSKRMNVASSRGFNRQHPRRWWQRLKRGGSRFASTVRRIPHNVRRWPGNLRKRWADRLRKINSMRTSHLRHRPRLVVLFLLPNTFNNNQRQKRSMFPFSFNFNGNNYEIPKVDKDASFEEAKATFHPPLLHKQDVGEVLSNGYPTIVEFYYKNDLGEETPILDKNETIMDFYNRLHWTAQREINYLVKHWGFGQFYVSGRVMLLNKIIYDKFKKGESIDPFKTFYADRPIKITDMDSFFAEKARQQRISEVRKLIGQNYDGNFKIVEKEGASTYYKDYSITTHKVIYPSQSYLDIVTVTLTSSCDTDDNTKRYHDLNFVVVKKDDANISPIKKRKIRNNKKKLKLVEHDD